MFLIVGATGNVGSQVADGLLARGEQVRVFTRDQSKLADVAKRWGDPVEVVQGDLTQPESFEAAVKGVRAVFLMNAALDAESFRMVLEGAKRQGVRRIIFLSSVLAARPDLQIGLMHKVKEDAIRDAGFEFTSVRATGFMSNVRVDEFHSRGRRRL
ncbi:SDR family oxidoreductase [Acidicapsa dinghuensis]|uniref:SDR family oxidoreductase n=1 Tax=Acidicapsa dinghuensis TaxID=2218256 RepID=A0ABW1EJP7_9BACT|nr:SDR family NAD(P)-dependent oxidoreductase [Acidicapsa dinghuensis]